MLCSVLLKVTDVSRTWLYLGDDAGYIVLSHVVSRLVQCVGMCVTSGYI